MTDDIRHILFCLLKKRKEYNLLNYVHLCRYHCVHFDGSSWKLLIAHSILFYLFWILLLLTLFEKEVSLFVLNVHL